MKRISPAILLLAILFFLVEGCATHKSIPVTTDQFFNGDALPDAPELAARGEYHVGVRTLDFINKGQVDILKSKGGVDPLYDRLLKAEVWYPAILPNGKKELTSYDDVLRSPLDST